MSDSAGAATAQSSVILSAGAFARGTAADVLAAARIAGIMAAKRVPDLIPLRQAAAITAAEISFTLDAQRNAVAITAMITGQSGMDIHALTAASVAALTLCDMAQDPEAVIETTRLAARTGGPSNVFAMSAARKSAPPAGRKSAPLADSPRETAMRGRSAQPKVLMGEVFGAKPSGPDTRREAFRSFMTRNRLRATAWAAEAGVPVGEILGYLTGQSRGFSAETAAKLARIAKVSPEDMFQ